MRGDDFVINRFALEQNSSCRERINLKKGKELELTGSGSVAALMVAAEPCKPGAEKDESALQFSIQYQVCGIKYGYLY